MSASAINPQVLDFLNRAATEPTFRAQFEQTDDQAETISKLRNAGYDFSYEELVETMQSLEKRSPDALPDAALADVTGGNGFTNALGHFGKFSADLIKAVGDTPFPGVDASGFTDKASDYLSKGIKFVINKFN